LVDPPAASSPGSSAAGADAVAADGSSRLLAAGGDGALHERRLQQAQAVCQGSTFFGGHLYAPIFSRQNWDQAKAMAETYECCGHKGHLVTIEDRSEDDFISTMYNGDNGWIGLTNQGVEGTWKTVNGQSQTYFNWAYGEPNNSGGSENCALKWGSSGEWNDTPCTGYIRPFVVEFDCNQPTPPPKPPTTKPTKQPTGVRPPTRSPTKSPAKPTVNPPTMPPM
jgi:hypothetical protein